ncbi:hypothetical protein [Nocardia asiatica]|uniref:hypothetical protein n=1 Tax=Nocardia asiatica TaxID=209252 RepID=UPI00031E045F|nr:hypothetical protein [Nocardia asiatica]
MTTTVTDPENLSAAFPSATTDQGPAPESPPERKPKPTGRARKWYVSVARLDKAARLVTALIDQGVYTPSKATDSKIRSVAKDYRIRKPSDDTCEMVRDILRARTRKRARADR